MKAILICLRSGKHCTERKKDVENQIKELLLPSQMICLNSSARMYRALSIDNLF